VVGWFLSGPVVCFSNDMLFPMNGPLTDIVCCHLQADYFGRRVGMGLGCFLTIIATFIQTFAPRGSLATFMVGRVIIGAGQAFSISECLLCGIRKRWTVSNSLPSRWTDLHR
jgi:MFS family permease